MSTKQAGVLVLSEDNVANVLDKLTTTEILSTIGKALYTSSRNSDLTGSEDEPVGHGGDALNTPTIQNPLRITTSTPNHTVLYMPSRLGTFKTTSIKVVSVPRQANDTAGLPAATLIIDEDTGITRAIINARSLTAVRTAAASALALSSSKSIGKAKTLLIYGAGMQAYWHARLVSTLSPQLEEVVLASRRDTARSAKLALELSAFFSSRHIKVSPCSFQEAASEGGHASRADVICCCTPSTVPLFSAEGLKDEVAISLIGSYKPHMQEIDLVPLARAGRLNKVIVDSREACLAEAGELQRLLNACPEVQSREREWLPELGELVAHDGSMSGHSEDKMLIFKSVGVGVMDAAISALVLDRAIELSQYVDAPF